MYPDYTAKTQDFVSNSDADLRSTFHKLIYGSDEERPRGTLVVLQVVQRDENGLPVKSPYTYKITGEGKHSDRGPNTTRTGYLCSEKIARTTFRPASRMVMDERNSEAAKQVPTRDVCFFSWQDEIKEHDVVIFIKTDDEGNPLSPIQVEGELNVTKVYPKRSDNGRIEYYAAVVEDQK